MKKLFKKLRVEDSFKMDLEIGRNKFIKKLDQILLPDYDDPFPILSEILSPSDLRFRGKVDPDGFNMYAKDGILWFVRAPGLVKGTFADYSKESVSLNIEISILNWVFVLITVLAVIRNLIVASILVLILNLSWYWHIGIFMTSILMLAFSFNRIINYCRRSIKNLRYEIERELFFLTKK